MSCMKCRTLAVAAGVVFSKSAKFRGRFSWVRYIARLGHSRRICKTVSGMSHFGKEGCSPFFKIKRSALVMYGQGVSGRG